MKKSLKRVLSIFLSVAMLFGMVSMTGLASINNTSITTKVVSSGKCGYYVSWELSDEGILTFSRVEDSLGAPIIIPDYDDPRTPIEGGLYAPWYSLRDQIKEIRIPAGIDDIGSYAFFDCDNLESVIIRTPRVGEYAFADCDNLESITVRCTANGGKQGTTFYPTEYARIGQNTFNGCEKIKTVYFAGLIEDWEDEYSEKLPDVNVYFMCGDDASWSLSEDKKTLTISGSGEMYDYYYNSSPMEDYLPPWSSYYFEKIVISEGITYIGCCAFKNETPDELIIPSTVTKIGKAAFSSGSFISNVYYNGTSLEWDQIDIQEENNFTSGSIHYLNNSNDENSGICGPNVSWTFNKITGELTISGTGDMYDYDHNYNESPFDSMNTSWADDQIGTKIIIENGVTSIGNDAFYNNWDICSVTISDSIARIGHSSFFGCRYLRDVKIPDSVINIGYNAFAGCDTLSSIFIGTGVSSIGSYACSGGDRLATITVAEGNQYYSSDLNGVLYNKNKTSLIQYPIGNERTSFEIPIGVTNIEEVAFTFCKKLTSVIIPDGVTRIGRLAFEDCTNLTSITIPSSISEIGYDAFDGCDSLVISCYENSYAHQYAVDENIPFTLLENPTVTHTVTYNFSYNGGTSATATAVTVEEGSSIDLTPTATKDGWTFVGWNTDENATTALSSINMGISDVTLYAIYKKTLTSTFIDYSGTTKKTRTTSIDIYNRAINGTVYAPAQNTYTGWTSRGWAYTTNADADAYSSFIIGQESDSYTFFGVYQRTLTLSYNANGGNTTPASQTGVQYVNSYNISNTKNPTITLAPAISRSGHNLVKWAAGNVDGQQFDAGEDVWISQNNTMYAIWDPILPSTHTVTYNYSYNGGTSATKTTETVEEGAEIDLTPAAAKNGWSFVGWNTSPGATIGLTSLNMGVSNVTLYAIYKKTITGTFIDYSGTTKKITTKTVDIYNKATSGTISAPTQNTYSGWTSMGWTTGTAANASATTNFTISSDTTYYGLYKRTLTLSYNANGGSSTPSSQTGTQYTNSYAISSYKNPSFTLANAISKSGSTFGGWAKDSTNGTVYNAGASITISSNTTMYAIWAYPSEVNIKVQTKDGTSIGVGAVVELYDMNGKVVASGRTGSDGSCTFSKSQCSNAKSITAYKDKEFTGGPNRAEAREKFGNAVYLLRTTSDYITSSGKWCRKSYNGSDAISIKLSYQKVVFNCSVSYYYDSTTGDYYSDLQKAFKYVNQYLQNATDGYMELGKVAIYSTNNKNAFYQQNSVAAKCDVQVRQYSSDSWGSNAWPNSHVDAALNDSWISSQDQYYRIQMQKIAAGADVSKDPQTWAKIVTHELGHYLLGFYDEYINIDNEQWSSIGRPYGAPNNYGLMEYQYTDLEMSAPVDYYYADRNGARFTTIQYYKRGMSCWEYFDRTFFSPYGMQASIPENERTYEEITNTVIFYDCRSYSNTYSFHRTKTDKTEATLFVMPYYNDGKIILKTNEKITKCTVSDFGNEYEETIQITKITDGYQISVAEIDSNKKYLTVESEKGINTFDVYSAILSADNGFSSRNNSILIQSADKQYAGVIVYNGEYQDSFCGRMVALNVEKTGGFNLIGRAGFDGEIDYSTLSWYKFENDNWVKIKSTTSVGEYSSLESKCFVTESGIYALMAAEKTANAPILPSGKTYFTTSSYSSKDGGITVNINYSDENVIGYRICYRSKDNTENVTTIVQNTDIVINTEQTNQEYYVNVLAIYDNGTEVELGKTQTVKSGEYYQEGSRIPYWWIVKYNLQKNENEIVDNKDYDGDGISNYQEYLKCTNPTISEKVNNIVKSVSLSDVNLQYKSSANLKPQITADNGASYTVTYSSSNPSVVSVDNSGKVTSQKQSGFSQGSAVITVTVKDSNGNTVQDTCKVSVQYAWWQWLIKIMLFGFIWY